MTEDFYDLLEIPPDASQDEIKEAYRDQVRVYHPDVNDDDRAQAQFTAVKTAYDILGDPVERQAYDRLGHEEYVAKRTSGLPSPDVWKSDSDDDEDDEDESGTELSYSESESETESESASASASASTASSTAAADDSAATVSGSTTGRSATTGAAGSRASTSAAGAASAGTATDSSSATGTGTGAKTGPGTGSGSSGPSGAATGESERGPGRASGTGTETRTGTADSGPANPLVRWWRRQNFSLPLIWLSVLVYAVGLGHFGRENGAALGSLWADVRGVGTDPAGLWALLSESRHGIDTTVAFVRGVEFVTPPLAPTPWYAALAGVVALALACLVGVRLVRREAAERWDPVTIDETIVVALAVTAATGLVGGPLLAGATLMPLLFGVIVRHTRRGPGWTPSYLYVLPVLAPLVGLGAAAAGVASLPADLAAFVVLPLAGALGLPLRATIRKHFGR
ncbi:J domain-containing protein [Natrinema salifodinae]|uniref:DnaJ domain-containing protein n=1 Tax=Natrinema salifodinae TaxID=1202768 RepID=A0A1I0MEG5_9EURY|nr:J domain-containing protein [Natrinema salifodinae]SEV86508.1 DnaJ domain-containing protein [Natrinema salifodinae]